MDGGRAELDGLMARLASGDRSALRPAFDALWPLLQRYCNKAAGSDGEDAAQGALIKVFAQAGDYDPSRGALPWALSIAAWECRTARKRRSRSRELPLLGLAERLDPRTPEEAAVEADLRAAALEVLGTLGPRDVEALLGEREGPTFRKRLQRALSRFRAAWRERHE